MKNYWRHGNRFGARDRRRYFFGGTTGNTSAVRRLPQAVTKLITGGLNLNFKLQHRIDTDTDSSIKLVIVTTKEKRKMVRLSYKVLNMREIFSLFASKVEPNRKSSTFCFSEYLNH